MSSSTNLVKAPQDILDSMLRTLRAGYAAAGIANPNLTQGSDDYIKCSALADQIAVALANLVVAADSVYPDTATGTDLDRILGVFGLARRSASQASGSIKIVATSSALIPTGAQLVSATGLLYTVAQGGLFSNGSIIPVVSKDTGSQTNLAVGAVLTFQGGFSGVSSACTVSAALTGGVDAENDSTARSRLLSKLSNPPALGNWSQVNALAEAADSVVQKSFCYPAANGPSTVHLALTAAPTTASVSRAISALKMTAISGYIQGNMPEYVETVVTTTTDVPANIAFSLAIPLASSSSTQIGGTGSGGGGWLSPNPWPNFGTLAPAVTAVTSSTSFSLSAPAGVAPDLGIAQISWIDRSTSPIYQVKTATVLTSSEVAGVYTITISVPFVGIAIGDYIFPAAANMQSYVNATLTAFSNLGPGEKTSVAGSLPRAYRKPRTAQSWPSEIGAYVRHAVENSATEVLSCDYYARSSTDQSLPAVISSPPKIFIPGQLGYYPATYTPTS
jgi:uncharacterized phage protein gp47/JayE